MQLPRSEILDAVETVFSDPSFERSSLLQRFGAWLLDVVGAFLLRLDPRGFPPFVFWLLTAGLVVAGLLALLARGGRGRRDAAPRAGGPSPDALGAGDAWVSARQYAQRGDYNAAAHALYAALLRHIAARGGVDLHDSKTIGDYARELSVRSSSLLARFRDFGRGYEWAIYGRGVVDRESYERLSALALHVVRDV